LRAAARSGRPPRESTARIASPSSAAARLAHVRTPVLLIVGGRDDVVLELNREAQSRLRAQSELSVVQGATHLFEEPGALEEVSRLAAVWFERHLARTAGPGSA
ncbi:MAG TPA: alpha/beta hydrolase, partial [Coriobacteriia bacterium]|nr:alpha/beta hydrolase [Coriobacteriia bacterium]